MPTCSSGTPGDSALNDSDSVLGLRIAALFVILAASTIGALLPVLTANPKYAAALGHGGWFRMPVAVTEFLTYFGSGVIIGTAFIHLLSPAIDALSSPCLSEGWQDYPYALGLCLISILSIFIVEIIAMRCAYRTRGVPNQETATEKPESPTSAHIVGIVILEFGAILHSVLIGLTLAASPNFKLLFAVLVIHQVFEGLGIGSRLASVEFPPRYSYVPVIGAIIFGLSTPMGLAIGLAVRTAYSPDDPEALIVSGILDSLSAGILLYTGLVELLAHEILFREEIICGPARKLVLVVTWVVLGCSMMALLGRWL
ncbi:ZIP-like iron-zinc transporter [Roridomyces roridus]|uniref:ZIP-like iron-zinc transporter n=1 Tax=Roridomyces roridus TaxID=1738132 RepID=A0AAD7FRY9_9AGAR|nr:ZIP-like iron-zinc transporter [Roridomyces roridus]